MKRIIIAGGGTGGHIFPAIAIANALKLQEPEIELLFVGAKGKMEMEKVPQAGYAIRGLDIAGFNRSSLMKNISLPYKLVKSFYQVREIVNAFHPDAVVGVGGYSSFPVLRYAQSRGIPTFIHESNSFAGKSNILLGKKATQIFVASAGMEKFFPAAKILVSGNPVRKAIVQSNTGREEAVRFFGLNPQQTTVLVIGGSLGARSINEVIASHITEFAPMELQLIWQTGKTGAEGYKDRGKPFSNVWVDSFIVEMDKAYAAADVVVSRAGAMSVAEIAVAGKPVIFVPYPHAAEDHQTVNARYLVDRQAAKLVRDADVRSKLFSTVVQLAKDKQQQQELHEHIRHLAITNADTVIANEILKHLK
jgi:UDP-N-acetylglucosamine--N-acetylmuramyl-(pentapeptide) pyrophosphoryl-undecaprenol N-acetylglucosamine transferase